MADFKQLLVVPNGVSTPTLSGVNKVTMLNGMGLNTVQTNVTPTSGTFEFSLVSGAFLNGDIGFKLDIPGGRITGVITISAQAIAGVSDRNQISVTATSHQNPSIALLNSVQLWQNAGSTSITVIMNITSTFATAAPLTICTIGDMTTDIRASPKSVWTVQSNSSTIDARGLVTAEIVAASVDYDMGSLMRPGMVSVAPALTASAPSAGERNGTLFCFGSMETGTLGQLFMSITGKVFYRNQTATRSAWSAWSNILTSTDRTEILAKASSDALIWAIVMG